MGDRGNILVKGSGSEVYLYSHWRGSELPVILQAALKRKQRWDDTPYLTRIIFNEMTKGNEGGETGFGISSNLGDGDNKIIEVNTDSAEIKIRGKTPRTFTFQSYIEQSAAAIDF